MKVKDIFNFLNAKKIIGDENLDISKIGEFKLSLGKKKHYLIIIK